MTSKKAVLAELEGAHRAAAKERAERERKNIADVAEFAYQRSREGEVDQWLTIQTERLQREAEERRGRHRAAAGTTLRAIESRGEAVKDIASLVDMPTARVQEYLAAVNGAEATKRRATKKRAKPTVTEPATTEPPALTPSAATNG